MLANVDHCTERNSKVVSGLSAHFQQQPLTLERKPLAPLALAAFARLLAFPGEDTSPDYCTVLHVIYRVI